MLNAAKALIRFLKRKGNNAFFIGGKCRIDLHNIYHPDDKLMVKDIDIITDANIDDIKKLFPTYIESSNPNIKYKSITITFANKKFELAFFQPDNINYKSLHTTAKVIQDDLISAGNMDIDRSKRDFTINAVVQDHANQFIDYIYKFNRKRISAMLDIYEGTIRCIGTPVKRFTEDPMRILRMFRFQSQLGYTIHPDTWKGALDSKHLITKYLSLNDIHKEFNDIIAGRFAKLALINMKEFGFFNLIFNVDEQKYQFFSCLNEVDEDSLQQLEDFNRTVTQIEDPARNNAHAHVDLVEAYILLLSSIPTNKSRFDLETTKFIDQENIERILWIIEHQELFDITDLHHKIYNIKNDGILKEGKRLELLHLMKHIKHIVAVLNSPEEGKAIYDVFCYRPFFPEQLRVTTGDIIRLTNNYLNKDSKEINEIKEAIIKRMLEIDGLQWPYEYKNYMEYVKQGINDILPDVKVNIPKWLGLIDDYGNEMFHHKAIQHFRVPFSVQKLSDLGLNSFEELEDILHSNNEEIKNQLKEKIKQFRQKDIDEKLIKI